jgi:hypothetical protein
VRYAADALEIKSIVGGSLGATTTASSGGHESATDLKRRHWKVAHVRDISQRGRSTKMNSIKSLSSRPSSFRESMILWRLQGEIF